MKNNNQEASCRELLSEMQAIFNSTHNLIICIDIQGKVSFINDTAKRLLNIEEGAYGKDIVEVFPNGGLIDVLKTGRSELLSKIELNGNLYLSNRTPVIRDGKIIGAVSVMQDISEIDEISRELETVKKINAELETIFETSLDALWLSDGTGRILKVNQSSEKIFGLPCSELVNRHSDELVAKGVFSRSIIMRSIETRKAVTALTTTQLGKTTITSCMPILDENGQVTSVVTNIRDMTEFYDLQNQMAKLKDLSKLSQMNIKMEELQQKYIHKSLKMQEITEQAFRLAEVDCSVIISGESGVGKEIIAETIHGSSARQKNPFIKVNCGAIPENLIESELFGYESGAFTGAHKSGKIGLFALANKGTILLDEIGEMPLNLQVKLLRVVQEKAVTRVGGTVPMPIDVRIIAATNRNLLNMIEDGEFRSDLYYRLNVANITIPPLHQRRDDILPLMNHFLRKFNEKYNKNKSMTPELINCLLEYKWPGNVRELENLMERLVVVTTEDIITTRDLPNGISPRKIALEAEEYTSLQQAVDQVEQRLIKNVSERYRTTREMAKALGIHQSTFIRKAARYGIKTY